MSESVEQGRVTVWNWTAASAGRGVGWDEISSLLMPGRS